MFFPYDGNTMNALLILFLAALQAPDPAPPVAPQAPPIDEVPAPSVGDSQGAGLSREQMWRAPTPEDWQRPVLIPFQRTWEDALAVSRETGKPIMACINMDGEIASEHYAGVRYRQSEVAALFEPYVCVIASVYRHNARDFDTEGRRILCPRFGSVTCGEHIAMEPILYEKYLDGERVAPRHVVIELDGSESRDIYYANDTASVFRVVYESAQGRPQPRDPRRADRPLLERVASADLSDREAVEEAFKAGSAETKRKILEVALADTEGQHGQLWRLALHSGTPELARLAVKGLAQSTDPGSIDLILDTLRSLEHAGDRDVLVGTLERIGEKSPRARTLVRSLRGLSAASDAVDGAASSRVLAESGRALHGEAADRLEGLAKRQAMGGGTYARGEAQRSPIELAEQALLRAEAQLELVRSGDADPRFVGLYLEDLGRDLEVARPLLETQDAWRWELVDIAFELARGSGPVSIQAAEDRAADLVPTLSDEARAKGGLALRDVLVAFAHQRQRVIRDAVRGHSEWPEEWMADAREAFRAIQDAPATTAAEYIDRRDFLGYMGAFAEADALLEAALQRFPVDPLVHDRLRRRLLWDKPLDALDGIEGRYESLLLDEDAPPALEWYAGYASRTAAEVHRRQGATAGALAAYGRALAHFQRAADRQPSLDDSCRAEMAACVGGQARVALESGDLEEAEALLFKSFELAPLAAATLDGLNTSPILTAELLRARLDAEAGAALDAKLEQLRQLDPRLFDPPVFERTSIGRRPVGFGGSRFSGPR